MNTPVKRASKAAEKLWSLLDDIDTASDMFKPVDLEGYKKFYEYAMRKTEERHNYMYSNGHKLTWPDDGTAVLAEDSDAIDKQLGKVSG